MGAFISKIINQASEPKTVQPEGTIFEDPRSPTVGVQRTPLSQDNRHYLETDIDNLTPTIPLRVKLLKRAVDPRSPTVGINRTPLSFVPPEEFGSPVSLYSNFQDDLESFSCIPSPSEPSVNVSDFETERFAKELDSLVHHLNVSLSDDESPKPKQCASLTLLAQKPQTPLSLETKKFCEGLIQEIIDSFKECEQEMNQPVQQAKLIVTTDPETPQSNRLTIRKTRKPLSNITSAGNTPTNHKAQKDMKRIKVEMTGENSPLSINTKPRAQWDQDATIII